MFEAIIRLPLFICKAFDARKGLLDSLAPYPIDLSQLHFILINVDKHFLITLEGSQVALHRPEQVSMTVRIHIRYTLGIVHVDDNAKTFRG